MSLLRPPYADDEYGIHPPLNTNNRLSQQFHAPPSPPATPGPTILIDFPKPVVEGREVRYSTYGASPITPHTPSYAPARPPLQPHIQSAPPHELPHSQGHLGPATAYMQYSRPTASEARLSNLKPKPVVPSPNRSARRLTPDELTESIALRRFQENQLHPEDRNWHSVVPKSFQESLSPKERTRQEELFEVIASEQFYISELDTWITAYRDPLRTQKLLAPHVLEPFIKEVFGNIEDIKRYHEALLRALFETQKRDYRQIHSLMDDLLEIVSKDELQHAYVQYISNIQNAISRHAREVQENAAYAQFVSSEAATARDARVRRLPFDSFLQRANKRLGQLKLQIDSIKKRTELDHFDIESGSLEMLLRILHRIVMRGQANGQGLSEQNALRSFRENLENPAWELADMGLAQKYRAVKFEGSLIQVEPRSTTPVHTVLLDNYLVFTHIVKEGSNKKRMVHKPIPLELLDARLETTPMRTRTRVASILSRQDTSEVVRFTIKRNGVDVLQLGARSKVLAEKWIEHMLEEATLRRIDVDTNKLLCFSMKKESSNSLRGQGNIRSACVLVHEKVPYTICGTTKGVFMGFRFDVQDLKPIREVPNVTKVVAVPGMPDIMVLHGGVLTKLGTGFVELPKERVLSVNENFVEVSDPSDGPVFAVCGGTVEGRPVLAFTTKHYLRKRLHIYAYNTVTQQLDRLHEPISISDSVIDLSIVSNRIFLVGKDCGVVNNPFRYAPLPASWPDFSPPFADTFGLQSRCSASRFLSAVQTGSNRILLVYDTHGCFVDGSGRPIAPLRSVEWEITPTAATYCGKYIALVGQDIVEVRDGQNGRLLQILEMPGAHLLCSLASYSANEKVLLTLAGADGRHDAFGELLPTVNISPPSSE